MRFRKERHGKPPDHQVPAFTPPLTMNKTPPLAPAAAETVQNAGDAIHPDPRQMIYLPEGPFAAFHKLNPRHHLEQENAALRNDPANEYPIDPFALGED